MLFSPGHIDVAPAALNAMKQNSCLPIKLLARHLTGDWGVVGDELARANKAALQTGNRVHSRYQLSEDCSIEVITEWGLPLTTFVLPRGY